MKIEFLEKVPEDWYQKHILNEVSISNIVNVYRDTCGKLIQYYIVINNCKSPVTRKFFLELESLYGSNNLEQYDYFDYSVFKHNDLIFKQA